MSSFTSKRTHLVTMSLRSLVVMSFCVVLVAQPVSAAYDQQFYSDYDILFYNPDAQFCDTTSSDTFSTGASSVQGSENAEIVLKFFTQKGLSLAGAAGILGNIMHESPGINPKLSQGGSTTSPMTAGVGYGIVQWTTSDRQAKLRELAKNTGRDVGDLGLQLDFVWYEMTHAWKSTLEALNTPGISPSDAAIITHGKTSRAVSTANSLNGGAGDPRFKNAPVPGYEASGDTAQQIIANRVKNAEAMYKQYESSIEDGGGVSGVLSTDYAVAPTKDLCDSSSVAVASTECSVTAPITGAGGNGHQLTRSELVKIYGPPDPATMSKKMVAVNFLGKQINIHPLAAGCLTAVANEIKTKGIDYDIKSMGGYRYDSNNGSTNIGEKSYHTYGVAVDINPQQNPFTTGVASYDMPEGYIAAFNHHGWSWGGNWRSVKDYMHFEFNGIDPSQ